MVGSEVGSLVGWVEGVSVIGIGASVENGDFDGSLVGISVVGGLVEGMVGCLEGANDTGRLVGDAVDVEAQVADPLSVFVEQKYAYSPLGQK